MNKFDFNIGATVHCKNGKCGKLHKLVVDPESMAVTDLIVSNGLILTEDRVVPVSDVDRATEDYVMLSVNNPELEEYPEYHKYNYDVVRQKSKKKSVISGYVAPHVSQYGVGLSGRYIPVIHHQRVHTNVKPDQVVIERGTPVYNQRKKVSSVDHMLVDSETGELTHLVVDPGLFSNSVIIPITQAERVDDDGIFVNFDEKEIDQFPEYIQRDDDEILVELREPFTTDGYLTDIDLRVDNGVLTMDGSVPDVQTKRRLEYAARTIDGVLEVENNLTPRNVMDSEVSAALANDPRTEFTVIEVIEDRNIVTLRGQVDSVEIMQAAIEIAEAQPGVLRVINGLSVKEDEFSSVFVTQYTRIQLTP